MSDQGYGDAVVYCRVGSGKFGAVESTLVDVFKERLSHADHSQKFYFIGHGEPAVRFLRKENVLGANNKVKRNLRQTPQHIERLRRRCNRYVCSERDVVFTYHIDKCNDRYNGNGFVGTGGPRTEWLRFAVNEYLQKHYPELQDTLLCNYFRRMGWILVFTVPYWATSQPIEQVWCYIKAYVALRWFPGRTMAQLRSQIICGMYGLFRVGEIATCWKEPEGLAPHSGMTPELTQKSILHSHKAINQFIRKSRHIRHMGGLGHGLMMI